MFLLAFWGLDGAKFNIISIKSGLVRSFIIHENKKQLRIVNCHGPHFINSRRVILIFPVMFAGLNNQSSPHYLCWFSNLFTVNAIKPFKIWKWYICGIHADNYLKPSLSFLCLLKVVKILNEQRWQCLHRRCRGYTGFSVYNEEIGLVHSRHLWVLGSERIEVSEGWRGEGEERIRTPQ